MFRRRNSQKPGEDFYMDFKNSYPGLGPPRTSAPAVQDANAELNAAANHSSFFQIPPWDPYRDDNHTPRGYDSISGTKSPQHIDNMTMINLDMSHAAGPWPPTPGGSTFFGGPSGDLHQHIINPGLETPISASASNRGPMLSRTGSMAMGDLMPQNSPHLAQIHQTFDFHQGTQGFAPGAFSNYPTTGNFEAHGSGVNMVDIHLDNAWSGSKLNPIAAAPLPPGANENFRFRVVLKEKTSMIKGPNEIPVTYLNKSQTYSISITDTMPECSPTPSKYRTAIRVSFEEEHQRTRPAAFWQLWKEGRGTNEAHKRGGKLQAVEYVNADHTHVHDVHSNVRLAAENFDGFSVEWTTNMSGSPECIVQARFNFLSTDFSHSKGVKGIPVRLCAKTEVVDPRPSVSTSQPMREICYCSVKTFRDHGSERKLQNDKAHVKKCIEKTKQQMEQAEAGIKESGKRRRSDSIVTPRPNKIAKHKRSWSVSSTGSLGGQDPSEGELQQRLRLFEGMFNSIRSASVLNLPGEERDDLDTHPVPLHLPIGSSTSELPSQPELKRESTQNTLSSSKQSPATSSGEYLSSPMYSQSRTQSFERAQAPQAANLKPGNPQPYPRASDGPTKIKKVQAQGDGRSAEWIEALGVDRSYQPPPELASKPVACFYIKPSVAGKRQEDDYYRAIYLMRKDLDNLVGSVAAKCGVEAGQIINTIRVNATGLEIKVEEEMVRQMDEGQDLLADLDVADETPVSAEEFFQSNEEDSSVPGSAANYKLTLRF